MTLRKTATVLVLLLAGIAIYALLELISPLCENEILGEMQAPDREFTAVIFERGCGATTGYSYNISILSEGSVLDNEAGNALIAESPMVPDRMTVAWTGDRTLTVSLDPSVRIFRAESPVAGIEINYEHSEPSSD